MTVKKVITGELEENCYLIEDNNKVLVIDPGSDFNKIRESIGQNKVLKVLITHHHFDHVGALEELLDYYKVEYIDYSDNNTNYEIDNFKFIKRYNKGHTKDSVSYYFYNDNMIFVGDFIFKNSIGRTDLEGGSDQEMLESISKIKELNDDLIIYPGHGDQTNLGYEKENNYFFK